MKNEEEIILEIISENPGISLKKLSVLYYMKKNDINCSWRFIVRYTEASNFHYTHIRHILEMLEFKGYIRKEIKYNKKKFFFPFNEKSKDIYNNY